MAEKNSLLQTTTTAIDEVVLRLATVPEEQSPEYNINRAGLLMLLYYWHFTTLYTRHTDTA